MNKSIIIFALYSLFLTFGCSSGQVPLTPEADSLSINSLPVFVSDINPDGSISGGMGLMGLFNLDYFNETPSLTPLRRTSLTDVLEIVDITNFLSLAPCTDCVKIDSIAIDIDGNAVLSIGIKHPFDVGDPAKPISGQNRADLHVFNVEGIVFSDSPAVTYAGIGESSTSMVLLNSDGCTGYLDDSIDTIYPTEASVHPYITHFDDYSAGNFDAAYPTGFQSVVDPPPSGNLVMAMGSDYDFQDYVFKLDSAGEFSFIFGVGCTYAVSAASKQDRFTPEYRVPQHNKKAASEVSVEIIDNGLRGSIVSSSADLEIHVVDISQDIEIGDALDQMKAESSVDDIFLEIPGIISSIIVLDGNATSPSSGTGHDPSDPLVYEVTVTNDAGAVEGTYTGLVKVTDTYAPGQNESPLLGGSDGIERVSPTQNPLEGLFAISDFAAYCVFEISVAPGCGPITGSIITPDCPISNAANGQRIDFEVTASSDNGGAPIVLYEVDFDYDGVSFAADDSNLDGIFSGVGPFTVPDPCPSNIPLDYTVAFRATDSCATPNETIFATCLVTVDNCLSPVGNVVINTNRTLVANGWTITDSIPFVLSWDPAPGAAEYAVYYDNDPSDGLMNDFQFVGVTISEAYTVPWAHLPSNHYVVGNTYIVRSRAIAGDPSSEAADSEPAHIMVNDWETLPTWSYPGVSNNGEGWLGNCETGGGYYNRPYVAPDWEGCVHGIKVLRMPYNMGSNNMGVAGRWAGVFKETPTVPNADTRFLELSLYIHQVVTTSGLIIGTCSTQPQNNWSTPEEMEWADVLDTGDYTGYNTNSPDAVSTFDDVPSTQNNAFYNPLYGNSNALKLLVGGDVNLDGNPDDAYIGVEIVKLGSSSVQVYPFMDEFAIMIY